MSTRSQAQQQRLDDEKVALDRHLPGSVKWIDPTGDTKLEIIIKSNDTGYYTLRIYIDDFPNSLPDMVVASSPKPMPDWGVSSEHHTCGRRDGCLKICHYDPSEWTGRFGLTDIIAKGHIWLMAYEEHLKNGKRMSDFLGDTEKGERPIFIQVRSGQRVGESPCITQ